MIIKSITPLSSTYPCLTTARSKVTACGMTSLLTIPVCGGTQVPGSPSGWSAPLLFEASSLGLGATAGFSKVSTMLVLDTAQAVLDFLHTQVSLWADCNSVVVDTTKILSCSRVGQARAGLILSCCADNPQFCDDSGCRPGRARHAVH